MTKLASGCAPVDELLGGGLEPSALTLVFGEAGTGKTNLCLQLACRAVLEGRGKVLYVDTEGVSLERLHQIAGPDAPKILPEILFFTPRSLEEQDRTIKSLEKITQPGLLIVDSFNLYYRLGLGLDGGSEAAARSLTGMLGDLLRMTRHFEIPGILTGQVYTKDEGTQAFGGRIMEHIVKAIVRFERLAPGARRATLLKHRSQAEGRQAEFFLTNRGLAALPAPSPPI